jgi:DNA-directed RNA polymerase
MGNDLCRGLLRFTRELPIGKNGIRYMKIHVANKMGKDKLSFEDRVGFVDDSWSEIEKWLTSPLTNNGWMELEDCYQALAAMKELQNAMNADFPEDFCSAQAIHADGSCNGLQHYAALGRDIDGGFEVNLVKRDTPGDVYTKVAKIVQNKMLADINDPSSPYHKTAVFLGGTIKRKIVKQTVMTTVYGVTYFGAKKQIRKQLKEFYDFESETDLLTASVYLAKLTLGAVEDLFTGAHQIKEWLIDCAKQIGKTGEPVSWMTPLELPIIQPYRKDPLGINTIKTTLNFMNVMSKEEENCPVDKLKQASAFPPNFIHALDSTHLMLTSERMKTQGYDFASVHDSYWCHIRNYEDMQRFLREEFVRMQEMKPLHKLHESFCRRYPDLHFKDVPPSGSLDIHSVLEATYFFS